MPNDGKERKNVRQEELNSLRPEDLFRPLDRIIENAPPLEPLWGYFFFRKHVTSLVGDPGISKTTLGYKWLTTISNGKPFLGIMPDESVKVLYMDFESSDSLIASRSMLVKQEKSPNFIVYNLVDYYLPEISTIVVDYCRENDINIIVIDNQSMAFNTRDENDNSEAKREMRFIRSIAVACNAAVFIYHHPSKGHLPGTKRGSGAYARARLADVMYNLEYATEDNQDVVVLEQVKNRLIDEKLVWYLRKQEGEFIFTEAPNNMDIPKQATNTLIYEAQTKIMDILQRGVQLKAEDIIKDLEKMNVSKDSANNAIRKLKQQRRIVSIKYGFYERADR